MDYNPVMADNLFLQLRFNSFNNLDSISEILPTLQITTI